MKLETEFNIDDKVFYIEQALDMARERFIIKSSIVKYIFIGVSKQQEQILMKTNLILINDEAIDTQHCFSQKEKAQQECDVKNRLLTNEIVFDQANEELITHKTHTRN